ncbi:hypothetical protein QC764_116335 [Podospora pseudoanserina]|uniref:Uncharacterized protein n=1 Tax=Podospora pseudoanserina TaxID=2609844 RepID=A0ABR0IRQ5_9PEZI|nr:hypothetical protein QC764_116335 [Podospora pseudoanserina]
MNPQKSTPARNARALASPPTQIPAPATTQPSASTSAEGKQAKGDDKLEDVLKTWSNSRPERKSLPFLNDLHKFHAFDETRSHLDEILKGEGKFAAAASTPKPVASFLSRRDMKHLRPEPSRETQSLPSTPISKKTGIFGTAVVEPTAPGSKTFDITPWKRESPPTPTPGRVIKGMERMQLDGSYNQGSARGSSPSGDVAMSSPLTRPIPVHGKGNEKGEGPSSILLPFLDLPLPPMGVVGDDEVGESAHKDFKPIYTQSYVDGVLEAMTHAHGNIARLSQEKREAEGRLVVLEEKMKMWHAIVHGQGCHCVEGRWWGEMEEGLIELRGGKKEGSGGAKNDKKYGNMESEEKTEMGRFGMDGAGDGFEDGVGGCKEAEDEEAWDVIVGSRVGSPEIV